ncbi:hypothetical protein SLA2020_277340 [Shorea laevis]
MHDSREANFCPTGPLVPLQGDGLGATMVTPRQACPWPRLRAQLAFKDSMVHGILQFTPSIAFRYVLHRCESRDILAESRYGSRQIHLPHAPPFPRRPEALFVKVSLAQTAPGSLFGRMHECLPTVEGKGEIAPPPSLFQQVHGSFCWAGFDNDPSAGSDVYTLLRLLLPLNDKVQWTSRDVAGGEPPPSPRSEHFTGPFNR